MWSDFSHASSAARDAMLLGILDSCCMRQLTTVHRAIAPNMRMDIVGMLPVELSLRVLQYLDARSLCRAAQVSHAWARLANADEVWHRMCLQHIDKKCSKCGWGLPLLTRKRKRRCVSDPAGASAAAAASALASVEQRRREGSVAPAATAAPAVSNLPTGSARSVAATPASCAGQMPVISSIPVSALLNPSSAGDLSDDGAESEDGSAYHPAAKRFKPSSAQAAGAAVPAAPAAAARQLARASSVASTAVRGTTPGPAGAPASSSSVSTDLLLDLNDPLSRRSRRNWKGVYAERLIVGRNWRQNNCVVFPLVPPTASLQPRITACHLDEPYLMTSAMDGLVRLWNLETRTCVQTLAGHRGAVTCVHFDESKCLALSGGMDGTVKIWNYSTGACVRSLSGGHAVPVTALHFDGGVLASADAASLIRVWDFEAKSCFSLCHGNMCPVTRVVLCKGYLYSAGEDGVVRMWDLNTRGCIRTFAPEAADPVPGTAPAITGLHVANVHVNGGHAVYVLTGSADGRLHLYNATAAAAANVPSSSSPVVVAPILSRNHGAPVTSVWFDSLRILSCGTDGLVHLWDQDSGDRIRSYTVGGSAGVVTGSDTRIVCAREDGVVHVWDFGRRA
ncbi:hypothetical protein H9P43_005566 [Blastocladiella emersonii ATCC 22665]|nr:hypothetical protein H9P43_005566 [Blastocladiella emersonii ATCC 22665]